MTKWKFWKKIQCICGIAFLVSLTLYCIHPSALFKSFYDYTFVVGAFAYLFIPILYSLLLSIGPLSTETRDGSGKNRANDIIEISKEDAGEFEKIRRVFLGKEGADAIDITPKIIRGMKYYMYALYVSEELGEIFIRYPDGREEKYDPMTYKFPDDETNSTKKGEST